MIWWEFAQAGDRVVLVPTGQHGTIVSIHHTVGAQMPVFIVQLDDPKPDEKTYIQAPADSFTPEDDVPVHDVEALEKWLTS